jgi:hypothetical protein
VERYDFSLVLEMSALARMLGLDLRAVRHAIVYQELVQLDPDATASVSTPFVVPDNQCAVLARCDLSIFPGDAGGVLDYTRRVSGVEADNSFVLTFTRGGSDDLSDEHGARTLSGAFLYVLPPGSYVIKFDDQRGPGSGEEPYYFSFRLDAYLLPETAAEDLRQCETRILG